MYKLVSSDMGHKYMTHVLYNKACVLCRSTCVKTETCLKSKNVDVSQDYIVSRFYCTYKDL
jgi:hypothetical protein